MFDGANEFAKLGNIGGIAGIAGRFNSGGVSIRLARVIEGAMLAINRGLANIFEIAAPASSRSGIAKSIVWITVESTNSKEIIAFTGEATGASSRL